MNILDATVDDVPALVNIGHRFFEHNPYRKHSRLCEESLTKTLSHMIDNHVLLSFWLDAQVVGCAGAMIAPVYWNHDEWQGLELFWWLDEHARGNGNGKALRQALERAAKDRGVKFWHMACLEESEPERVSAMYLRAGMTQIERVFMKVL